MKFHQSVGFRDFRMLLALKYKWVLVLTGQSVYFYCHMEVPVAFKLSTV